MNTLERAAFERLVQEDTYVPRTWASAIRTHERLVAQHLATEIAQPSRFIRQFTLVREPRT